ncbi:MAG: accessory factor UbiK family protein [Gammaproteobacteria bacterium]
MSSDHSIENLVKQILAAMPADLRQARLDMEKNLKAIITAGLAKMDLVTREEFDVQSELLARTRAALEKIQRQLADLEEKIAKKK